MCFVRFKPQIQELCLTTVHIINLCTYLCMLGNGSKSAAAEADDDDEHISLAPQRSSFLTGCQVKRSAAGPDSKRDG